MSLLAIEIPAAPAPTIQISKPFKSVSPACLYITSQSLNDAVGNIAWRIFDQDGKVHPGSFNERIIGLSIDDLKNIPVTIAVAGGVEKARVILGALHSKVINVLCTDDKAATAILELSKDMIV